MQSLLLSGQKFELTLDRLAYQLIEEHRDFDSSALMGLQPRGIFLANALQERLQIILDKKTILCGFLDITFHRDDIRLQTRPMVPSAMNINFSVESKKVIMIDDVLFTGRTIRAGLDAMLTFGRPENVELLVLVDRRYSRELPIEPKYTGIEVDTIASQKVKVEWGQGGSEKGVWLISNEEEKH
ncbi:MAG: bifunctional pyr operon transcriptional regulator/uracil phosphoribosyltransferase PyrR [Bacteroidota bacterium]|nr:bifunctional pyr operon transcriptional regulator/uracil phosphoribosyltransferase PyrR [Bacteroidota bacterium]